jgi:hypothetical protein
MDGYEQLKVEFLDNYESYPRLYPYTKQCMMFYLKVDVVSMVTHIREMLIINLGISKNNSQITSFFPHAFKRLMISPIHLSLSKK